MSGSGLALLGGWLLAACLPVALCSLVVVGQWRSNWTTLSLLSFACLGALYALLTGAWTGYSYWSAAIVLAFMIWAVAAGLQRLLAGSWAYPGLATSLVCGGLFGMAAWFLYHDVAALRSMRAPERTVELAFPLEGGLFAIVQGGSGPPLQSSHLGSPAQAYAVDVTMINRAGLGRRSLDAFDARDWEIWGKPVLSPCAGDVAWSRDGIVDAIGRDPVTPAGNAVAIECSGVVVYLAHFRQGSLRVREGDRVATGQVLGEVGASGNTGGPHLHIHAEEPPLGGEFSQRPGVAMTFGGRFLWRPGIIVN